MSKTKPLVSAMKDLAEVLNACDVDFWLMYGALLGMVRDGKMLSWDHDIDLGMWEEDLYKIEKGLSFFHEKGFTVHFTESGHVSFNRKPIYISLMHYKKNDVMAFRTSFTIVEREWKLKKGFYCHSLMQITRALKYLRWIFTPPKHIGDSPKFISLHIQKMLLMLSFTSKGWVRRATKHVLEQLLKIGCTFYIERVPLKYFANLKKIDFYGIKISVPNDCDGYLEWQFGEDWRTPNPDYVPRSGCNAWVKLKHSSKVEQGGIGWKPLLT